MGLLEIYCNLGYTSIASTLSGEVSVSRINFCVSVLQETDMGKHSTSVITSLDFEIVC